KDVRLLRPEHAAGFVDSTALLLMAAGAALFAVGVASRRGTSWARPPGRLDVILVAAVAALAFAAATPYAVLRPQAFLSDLAFNQQTRHEYKGLVGAATSFGPYLELLAGALTGPLAITALAGLVVAAAGGGQGYRGLPAGAPTGPPAFTPPAGVVVAAGRAGRGDRAAAVVLGGALAPYLLVA